MTITAPDIAPAPARAMLSRARTALAVRKQADVDLLVAALEWAHANPAQSPDEVAGWGDGVLHSEGFLPLAGEGAPLVAEFSPFDLAATLGWSTEAARALMGDALELFHRLPQLWAMLCRLEVSTSTARYAAEQTRDLAPGAAAHADHLLVRAIGRGLQSSHRIRALVDEARLYHDPDRAIDDEQQALSSRSVRLVPGNTPATVDVAMILDTADAEAFDQTVGQIASILGQLGDPDSLDVRRARAVGILADPQTALDVFTEGQPVPERREPRAPQPATLHLHLDESALSDIDTFPAPIRAEGLRQGLCTLSSDLLAMWLADSKVVVRPVIDLNHPERITPVDRHDPPDLMAEFVRLRDPVCIFPGCQRSSRHCDLDHIEPYVDPDDGGPPGQTHPDALAPLCRGHHRAKTHGGWRYHRLPDGSYAWTSPTGQTFTVPARPWR
ncbi:MAG: HNH endonuclease signature motif containing protein [Nocardioides sp.]